jgi:hypothetical protein
MGISVNSGGTPSSTKRIKTIEAKAASNTAAIADVEDTENIALAKANSAYNAAVAAQQSITDDTIKATEALSKAQAAYDMAELIKDSTDVMIYKNRGCCIGQINNNNSSPDFAAVYGDKSILTGDKVWLVDMSQNSGTHAVKKELCRYNLLRYADGTFAPTVGITETQRAACDVALYLDTEATNLYCEAGAFDAEAFYNEHGMDTPLYDESGNAVRILRPWETTRTDLSIFIGEEDTQYLLETAADINGVIYRGVSKEPMTWEGVAFEQYKLNPTGLAMSSPVSINGGKLRCFFFVHDSNAIIDSNSRGTSGLNSCQAFVEEGRAFPRYNDMSAISNQSLAWNLNADNTKPYPFAEGGYFAYDIYLTKLELLHGTRYLHKSTRYGSGISSNDTCNSATTYFANGGTRYRVQDSADWTYSGWNGSISKIKNTSNPSNFANYYAPKEQCMESQMAYSYARERNIEAGTEFTFYGNNYRWENISELPQASADRMDVRVYKTRQTIFSADDTNGTTQIWELEYCLRMSLFSGLTASGDVYRYRQGGYEQVGTYSHLVSDGASGSYEKFPIRTYIEPDQTKWVKESSITKSDGGIFDFERIYKLVDDTLSIGNHYIHTRYPYSAGGTSGGNISSYDCAYMWSHCYWGSTLNSRVRIGARFGFDAYSAACAPRSVDCHSSVAFTSRNVVGSLQVLF